MKIQAYSVFLNSSLHFQYHASQNRLLVRLQDTVIPSFITQSGSPISRLDHDITQGLSADKYKTPAHGIWQKNKKMQVIYGNINVSS